MSNSTMAPGAHKQEWAEAADKAKQAAVAVGEMASHATSAVGAIASRAAVNVGQQADELTARAGVCIEGLGSSLANKVPHSGVLGNASQAVARTVKDGGEYLQDAKLSGITHDVAHVIRRNPIPAVLIAIGLGWFVGRQLRS